MYYGDTIHVEVPRFRVQGCRGAYAFLQVGASEISYAITYTRWHDVLGHKAWKKVIHYRTIASLNPIHAIGNSLKKQNSCTKV